MAKKEYRFAKKEKLRDHPFAKYIKEVPKKVMVNVERVKQDNPKTVNVKIKKSKDQWNIKRPKTR